MAISEDALQWVILLIISGIVGWAVGYVRQVSNATEAKVNDRVNTYRHQQREMFDKMNRRIARIGRSRTEPEPSDDV